MINKIEELDISQMRTELNNLLEKIKNDQFSESSIMVCIDSYKLEILLDKGFIQVVAEGDFLKYIISYGDAKYACLTPTFTKGRVYLVKVTRIKDLQIFSEFREYLASIDSYKLDKKLEREVNTIIQN